MKISEKRLRDLVLGILVALIAVSLLACDGGPESGGEGTDAGSAGLGHSDAGFVSCQVPSPTGDQPGAYGSQSRDSPYYVVVQNDSAAVCKSFKSSYKSDPSVPSTVALGELVKGMDCSSVAGDFRGSSGQAWCLYLTANDGVSACPGDVTGKITCQVASFGVMKTLQNPRLPAGTLDRSYGVCSSAGIFQGWLCGSH